MKFGPPELPFLFNSKLAQLLHFEYLFLFNKNLVLESCLESLKAIDNQRVTNFKITL